MSDTLHPPHPVVRTARLVLREARDEDVAALRAIHADPEAMRYYGMGPYETDAAALEELAWFRGLYWKGEGIRWVMTRPPEEGYIGDIGLFSLARGHARAEMGFKLARAHWRQGLMSEALPPTLAYGFEVMGLWRIEALADPRNAACLALLRKHGFTQEGILRGYEFEHGQHIDLAMLSLLRPEARL
jgi:ribosomal-protein-alanine N-acetyltransferase